MIETQYRDHKITYSENEDVWRCLDLDLKDTSLSKLKQRVDKEYLKLRKAAAFDCYVVPGYIRNVAGAKFAEARAIDYKAKSRRRSYIHPSQDETEHAVGIMAARESGDRVGKRWERLEALAPATEEAEQAMDRVRDLVEQRMKIEEAIQEALSSIPRLSFEDVQKLAEAAEDRIEEGS